MPKATVIMPAYNAAQFVEVAINSVLSQTFNDWELIVIDDGSSDATPTILEYYKNENIKIIRQENFGEAFARNVGLENARGEYVAFLDADDFYYPNALEDFVSFLDSHHQYDVVYSDGTICDFRGKELMHLSDIRPTLESGNLLESLVLASYMVTCCSMVRLSLIHQYCIRFDKNLAIGPDWDFWIQLATCVQFGYLQEVTGSYRIHTANITKTIDFEKRKSDRAFARLKVMNSNWFSDLSVHTRKLFFIDLLTNALSGDLEQQQKILDSEQYSGLPSDIQCNIWRMVGIDALQAGYSLEKVRQCLLKSNLINPEDKKTRFLLSSLKVGHTFTLSWINLWRGWLKVFNKLNLKSNSKAVYLQKLLEVQ